MLEAARNNESLIQRSRRAVWHPCTQMKAHEAQPLLPIARGKGVWLYDTEGRRYLDAISSWWVNLFGHANPHIKAALVDQLDRVEHVMLAGCTHEPVVELSSPQPETAPADAIKPTKIHPRIANTSALAGATSMPRPSSRGGGPGRRDRAQAEDRAAPR